MLTHNALISVLHRKDINNSCDGYRSIIPGSGNGVICSKCKLEQQIYNQQDINNIATLMGLD